MATIKGNCVKFQISECFLAAKLTQSLSARLMRWLIYVDTFKADYQNQTTDHNEIKIQLVNET